MRVTIVKLARRHGDSTLDISEDSLRPGAVQSLRGYIQAAVSLRSGLALGTIGKWQDPDVSSSVLPSWLIRIKMEVGLVGYDGRATNPTPVGAIDEEALLPHECADGEDEFVQPQMARDFHETKHTPLFVREMKLC
jgi:hypothetical protein